MLDGESECAKSEVLEKYLRYYNEDPVSGSVCYPGIPEALRYWKEKGCILAVLSNKPNSIVQKIVTTLFDEDLFSQAVGQREDVPRKPYPQAVYAICDNLHVKKEEVLLIGDSEVDAILGENAAVDTVLFTFGFRTRKELEVWSKKGVPLFDTVEEWNLWMQEERNR